MQCRCRRYRLFLMTSRATLRQVPTITAKFVCQRKYPFIAVVSGQIFWILILCISHSSGSIWFRAHIQCAPCPHISFESTTLPYRPDLFQVIHAMEEGTATGPLRSHTPYTQGRSLLRYSGLSSWSTLWLNP